MLHTPLCDLLGVDVPIIAAPMGFITGPELAAAVSNAGGFGVMSAAAMPPPVLQRQIRRLRELTSRPFGVNILLFEVEGMDRPLDQLVNVCIAEGVPVISFFWGNCTRFVPAIHAAGLKVMDQVGSVDSAERSARAGVDIIVAQGVEAGGHVEGDITTLALVPRVVDCIAPVPVVASGGIADGRAVAAALALGAEAAMIGTRFVCTLEAGAHPLYQERLLRASEKDTVRTILFGHGWPNAPHRVLRTAFVEEWRGQEARAQESRPDEPVIGSLSLGGHEIPLLRFMGIPPNTATTGDIDKMPLYAGQGVGLVREIKPAADVVRELVREAEAVIAKQRAYVLAKSA
jgi:nitronate monooxygenase